MAVTAGEVVEALFARAPRELAESWDNIGLIVGDPGARVRRALVCVDATQEIIAEARQRRAQLIVAHHPLFVEPIKHVRADETASAAAHAAARAGVSVCCMHTNLDYAPDGLCVELARMVGLHDLRPLSPAGGGALLKVAVFAPATHLAAVRQAMAAAGAGRISNYDECSFGVPGTGTYRPLPGATPYAGTVGKQVGADLPVGPHAGRGGARPLRQAAEVRLEMIVSRTALPRVLAAMEASHPYEEVAYDVYPLANTWPHGMRGTVGTLSPALTLGAFAKRVRESLGSRVVRVGGDARRKIRTIAVCSGSGGHLVGEAAAAHADALLLGELRHSDALRARALGLKILEAGHFATERPAVDLLRRWLEQEYGRTAPSARPPEAGKLRACPEPVEGAGVRPYRRRIEVLTTARGDPFDAAV